MSLEDHSSSKMSSQNAASPKDVNEIQDMSSSFSNMITAVRKRDVDAAQKYAVAGLLGNGGDNV